MRFNIKTLHPDTLPDIKILNNGVHLAVFLERSSTCKKCFLFILAIFLKVMSTKIK